MKKIIKPIALLLCFVTLSSQFLALAANPGDLNQDGKILVEDVQLILDIVTGIRVPTDEELMLADYNGDGVVTTDDVAAALEVCEDIDPLMFLSKFEQLTPTKKNASATKQKFVKVTKKNAETLSASSTSGKSDPIHSSLPVGTYDSIKSGPHSEGSKKYYKLSCGKRIYSTDVSVFTGYKMPGNTAQLCSAVGYNYDSTDLYIALDWRVPFNVTLKPQEYVTGYNKRKYNVKDGKFTATYMDITFYHTKVAEGNFTYPESSTIKSSKWIINKDKNLATLRVYLRETGGFYGYNAYYNENNYLIISIKEPTVSLSGRVIMVDPGHGGADPGAISKSGYYEKNLTYPIALKLKSYLENAGATVILTRGDSKSEPSIEKRRMMAINKNPDLYVAVHIDSATSSAKGSSVYYYKNYSAPLAFAISESLPSTVKAGANYTLKNRGAHFYPFHVTRVENCPSVLVECGFISNNTEFNMMKNATNQSYIAKGIYNGILDYFGI